MRRDDATKMLRDELNKHGLKHWNIRLSDNPRFVGLCSYKDRTIFLNTHAVDLHPDAEIRCTILHEVAHALTPGHNHDDVWKEKAREIGCDNTSTTCSIGIDALALDAIRSGHSVEAVVNEEVVRKVEYKITKLQDKCEHCGKIAKEKSSFESVMKNGDEVKFITLECGHLVIKKLPKATAFHTITFDGDVNCKHEWTLPLAIEYKTICSKCDAKRPYMYQVEGMRALERYNGRFGVFDEQGLGKTIQSLGYIKFHPEATPFIWFCKSGLKYQAMKEIVRVLGWSYLPYVMDTSKDHIFPGFKCYIISYDILRRLSREKIEQLRTIAKCAVIDEVQHIKNPDSTRTQEIRNLLRDFKHIIPLSGTHWKNRGSESFVACNLINPTKFNSFEGFKKRWVDYYESDGKYKEGGLRKGFREYCHDVFIRRERSEVMKELPDITRTKLYCQLPKEAMEAYDEQVDRFVKIWNSLVIGGEENSFNAAGTTMAALNSMRHTIGIAKVPATVDHAIEYLENTVDKKILIFVHHIDVGTIIEEQMKEWCTENGVNIIRLEGGANAEKRFILQEQFNNDVKTRVAILSTLAAGEGLNLQTCDYAIMHERQWNPMNEEQPEGRMIRIGQKSKCVTMVYAEVSATCDEDLDGIVSRKRIQFHNTMNKGEMIQWNQDSIIKELGNLTAERWRKKKAA